MEIHEGNTVRVVNPRLMHSDLKGRTGVVNWVSETKEVCTVNFEWEAPEGSRWEKQGALTSLNFEELEVTDPEEDRQIEGIANALYTEGGFGETLDSLRVIAVDLYKARVRFDG